MASGFTIAAGTIGFEAVEVAGTDFAGVVEAVTEAGGTVAVVDVSGVGAGAAGAVVVATAAAAGQRCP
jgi:hypothetical protein